MNISSRYIHTEDFFMGCIYISQLIMSRPAEQNSHIRYNYIIPNMGLRNLYIVHIGYKMQEDWYVWSRNGARLT